MLKEVSTSSTLLLDEGEEGITINGLVWMGTFEEMYQRLETKLKAGFRCVKLKIGAIDFEKELKLYAISVKHSHVSKWNYALMRMVPLLQKMPCKD